MNHQLSEQNLICHLARLSDCVFALAMAITFMKFEPLETIQTISKFEINSFLIEQLKSLGIYAIAFTLVAFYWINHIQQFGYFKKTNEIHLWIYILYLMSLVIVPFSNDLVFRFSDSAWARVWFSSNIALIGFFSFANWSYATHQRRLVDQTLNSQIILSIQIKALIEPICALISIPIALVDINLSDLVWFLIPIVSPLIDKALKKKSELNHLSASTQVLD